MNDRIGFACCSTMGKQGELKTLPSDNEDYQDDTDMDVKHEKELLSQKFSLIENMINGQTLKSETSDEDEENSKEESEKNSLGSSIEEEITPVTTEAQKRLTLENVLALNDLHDVFEFSLEHDINIDNLETVEECKERFLLHLEKEQTGCTKKQQVNFMKFPRKGYCLLRKRINCIGTKLHLKLDL